MASFFSLFGGSKGQSTANITPQSAGLSEGERGSDAPGLDQLLNAVASEMNQTPNAGASPSGDDGMDQTSPNDRLNEGEEENLSPKKSKRLFHEEISDSSDDLNLEERLSPKNIKKRKRKVPLLPTRSRRALRVKQGKTMETPAKESEDDCSDDGAGKPAFVSPATSAPRRQPTGRRQPTADDETEHQDASDDDSDKEEEASELSPQRKGPSAVAKVNMQAKQKVRQPPIRKGCRVKAKCSHIFHLLPANQQKHLSSDHPNYYNYCSTVVKKTVGMKANCDIQFDCFGNNEVAIGLRRNSFVTTKKNEDEPVSDPKCQAARDDKDEAVDASSEEPEEVMSEKEFAKQSKEETLAAKTFTVSFKNRRKDDIIWKMHEVEEDVEHDDQFKELKRKFDEGHSSVETLTFKTRRMPSFSWNACGQT